MAFWCHGAAGIGKFFLHASELGVIPEAGEIAARAARTVAHAARWAGPMQCHGLASNIEFLLDMFQATGKRAYLSEARSLARLLKAFASEQDGMLVWMSNVPTTVTPDYMVGYAGVAICLLRLADPSRRPPQLSRRGFQFMGTRPDVPLEQ
jgi:lantibiotic modifying enzyme